MLSDDNHHHLISSIKHKDPSICRIHHEVPTFRDAVNRSGLMDSAGESSNTCGHFSVR